MIGVNIMERNKPVRRVVEMLTAEISNHFDNEMRLIKMMDEANLSAEESKYLLGEMASHPHVLNNVVGNMQFIQNGLEALQVISLKILEEKQSLQNARREV